MNLQQPFWDDATQQQIFLHCMKTKGGMAHALPLLEQLEEIRNLPEPEVK